MMQQFKISVSITPRGTASLTKYLNEISKVPMITADEEVELTRQIRCGDEAAFERLVTANLRFVVSIAKKYQNQGIELVDLITEGNLGLMRAARRFDETRGFKFISYAVWWIRQGILNAIAEQSRVVRLPLNQVSTISKIRKETARLEQELVRMPTVEEVAEAVEMEPAKVAELLRQNGFHVSIDAPLASDEETKFIDTFIPDGQKSTDSELISESLGKELDLMMADLPETEQEVLKMFFGIHTKREYTLDEISACTALSHERVRQIKDRAIKRLRTDDNQQKLKQYL